MSLDIIKKYKIKAKKKLGQNFLVNDEIIEDIAGVIEVSGKNIIEVGPGYGALTKKILSKNPKSLNLIELDSDMISILENRIEEGDLNINGVDFSINKKDILKYTPELNNYDVIANIPYYITSPILRHFLYNVENKPNSMVILMQKDVGDKILSFPKNKSSVLSLMVEKKANIFEKIFVSKNNFIPIPKVESSVLLFEYHNMYKDISDEKFLKIIKIGFSAVRKKLVKNLENGGFDKSNIIKILDFIGFNSNVRGEDLNIDDWCELIKKL